MKFRRLACDCCKSSEFPSLCKSPTYVMSEVVDDSNVIFILMSKRGRMSCGGPLIVDPDPADDESRAVTYEHDLSGRADVVWSGRRAEEILDACRRPTYRLAGNDDFEDDESPIRRNRRLLDEGSGFWPRRVSCRDPDGAKEREDRPPKRALDRGGARRKGEFPCGAKRAVRRGSGASPPAGPAPEGA